jgi:hypothetical protein
MILHNLVLISFSRADKGCTGGVAGDELLSENQNNNQ